MEIRAIRASNKNTKLKYYETRICENKKKAAGNLVEIKSGAIFMKFLHEGRKNASLIANSLR